MVEVSKIGNRRGDGCRVGGRLSCELVYVYGRLIAEIIADTTNRLSPRPGTLFGMDIPDVERVSPDTRDIVYGGQLRF